MMKQLWKLCLLCSPLRFKQIQAINLRSMSLASHDFEKLPRTADQHQFFESPSKQALENVISSMQIFPDFITEAEERTLLDEVELVLKRIRYEQSHWDDAIHNYRETEHLHWRPENNEIIERVRKTAFEGLNVRHIKYVHILDIAKDGFIKPHVDSVRVRLVTLHSL